MEIVYHPNSNKTTIDGMRIYPTGSKLFGCSTQNSDIDYFCYASKDFCSKLSADGWVREDSYLPDSSFRSYRKQVTNIIVCLDLKLYARFKLATEICMKLQGPKIKEERIRIFQIILYGDHKYGIEL